MSWSSAGRRCRTSVSASSWPLPKRFRATWTPPRAKDTRRLKALECDASPLLRGLEAGEPDDLGPFLGFVREEPAKVAGRARDYSATEVGKTRFHPGISQPCVDLAIELFDDFGRRRLGGDHACPIARFVAGYELC